jgi:hypothetical protein
MHGIGKANTSNIIPQGALKLIRRPGNLQKGTLPFQTDLDGVTQAGLVASQPRRGHDVRRKTLRCLMQ